MQAGPIGALSRFQDAFARALLSTEAPADSAIAALAAQPAFAVYRNTVIKGSIDALQANFPAVTRLVGEEWLRSAAALHVVAELPDDPSLLAYGATFPAFLAGFGPAAGLPYLPDVARLDRLWTESHSAADAQALGLAAIAGVEPGVLGAAVLQVHPAARWAWFPDAPIYTIWSRNRDEAGSGDEFDWRGEGALLTRPDGTVRWIALDAAGIGFLEACAQGRSIAQASDAALQACGGIDLVVLLTTLLQAGAFSRLCIPTT
jgi:hypothetical protein